MFVLIEPSCSKSWRCIRGVVSGVVVFVSPTHLPMMSVRWETQADVLTVCSSAPILNRDKIRANV